MSFFQETSLFVERKVVVQGGVVWGKVSGDWNRAHTRAYARGGSSPAGAHPTMGESSGLLLSLLTGSATGQLDGMREPDYGHHMQVCTQGNMRQAGRVWCLLCRVYAICGYMVCGTQYRQ